MKVLKLIILIVFLNTLLFAEKKDRKYDWDFGITEESTMLTKFKDANVALKAWFEEMGELYNVDINVDFFNKTKLLYEKFNKKELDVMVLDIPFFFKNRKEIESDITDKWSLSIDNDKKTQYYLIGNKSKKNKGFSDLKNKTFSLKKDDAIARNWLNKKSYEKNRTRAKNLLKKLSEEKNDRRVLFNVFFGKVDYAIISKKAWEDMLSFNPSIEKKVEILDSSKKIFIPFIGVHAKWADEETKKLFYESSNDLTTIKGSEKVIEILKFDAVYKLDDEALADLDKYFEEYFVLEKKYK